MTIDSQNDIDALMRIGRIVSQVLQKMLDSLEPGMTTAELDAIGQRLLDSYGARSAPRIAYNFPGATCISINEEAAHGIPGDRRIQPGDMVNVDVSAELDGYFADTGGTRVVPPSNAIKSRLCRATMTALKEAMKQARHGNPINHIGKAVQKVDGISVTSIVGYYDPRDRRILHEGMVITIEPFLSTKSSHANQADDGWTLLGAPGNLSAQYEHTMIITRGSPIVVTTH